MTPLDVFECITSRLIGLNVRRAARLLASTALLVGICSVPALPAAADDTTTPKQRVYFFSDYGGTVGQKNGGDFAALAVGYRDLSTGSYTTVIPGSKLLRDSLQVSPDGSMLSYLRFDPSGKVSLWTITVDGMDSTERKVFAGKDDFTVRWSPDSTKLIFNDTQSADPRVRILTLATGALTIVPNSTGFRSPSYDPTTPTRIYGSNATTNRIETMPVSGASSPTVVNGAPAGSSFEPTVAPDGTIVFTHQTVVSNTAPKGDLMSLKSGHTKILATGGYNTRPTVSPDGATVWFDRFTDVNHGFIGDIYRVPVDGSSAATSPYPTDNEDEYWGAAGNVSTAAATKPVTSFTVSPNGLHPLLQWTRPTDDPQAKDVYVCRAIGTTAPANCSAPVYKGSASSFVDTVVLGKTYSYSVLTANAFGNRTATAVSVTALAMNAPHVAITSPTSSTTATPPFRVRWEATGAPSGTVYSTVWATKDSAVTPTTFSPWLTSTTATTDVFGRSDVPVSPAPGGDYYIQATAVDPYGNTTVASTGRGVIPLDDGRATYGSGWTKELRAGRWMGGIHGSTLKGAQAIIRLTGSSYSVIGERCTSCGAFRVYVDGVLKATVDTHASTYQQRQVLWTGTIGAITARNVRVQVVGTAGRSRVNLDGFAAWR